MSLSRFQPALIGLIAAFLLYFSLPSTSWASNLATAQFQVAAYLVRLWLALVAGTGVVIGVMLAMDGYTSDPHIQPVMTPDKTVQLIKSLKLSYGKIGAGLLCVILCGALFATAVFLLPDKRTGHSGIGKIVTRFTGEQNVGPAMPESVHSVPAEHQ